LCKYTSIKEHFESIQQTLIIDDIAIRPIQPEGKERDDESTISR
jgi:hypothetical protein